MLWENTNRNFIKVCFQIFLLLCLCSYICVEAHKQCHMCGGQWKTCKRVKSLLTCGYKASNSAGPRFGGKCHYPLSHFPEC